MTTVIVLFLLFDGIIHVTKPQPVVDAFAQLGYPLTASRGIGIVELICLVMYLAPRTALLGAVLLTGLLGGAMSAHVRAASPVFETYVFPVLVGLLIWGALLLREERLRALFPVRRAA
jgi:hypothetical protein